MTNPQHLPGWVGAVVGSKRYEKLQAVNSIVMAGMYTPDKDGHTDNDAIIMYTGNTRGCSTEGCAALYTQQCLGVLLRCLYLCVAASMCMSISHLHVSCTVCVGV